MPDIGDYDAMQKPVWTFVMTLAWIATRSAESVTWQTDDWRRKHRWPKASIPTSPHPDPGDDPHPAFFSWTAAMNELQSKGQSGELEIEAMSVATNRPVVLTPLDWSYGTLQFDHRYDEVWIVGGEKYEHLTVMRDNLLRVFPPDPATPSLSTRSARSQVSEDKGPQGLGSTVQILADAIWNKWGNIPEGFPRRRDRFRAIWSEAKARQPALADTMMPSEDSFARAENAVRLHLARLQS